LGDTVAVIVRRSGNETPGCGDARTCFKREHWLDTTVITSSDRTRIEKLAKEGKTIHEIRERLSDRYAYELIQAYMWEANCITLQGAKKAVSIRLRKILNARREPERERLANEIREFVDYIYYAGKDTQEKLEKARKARAQLKRLLDAQ